MLRRKLRWKNESDGIPLDSRSAGVEAFVEALPFSLTRAQRIALDDILGDIGSDKPMSRLLQGDVGSGKTVVAVAALLAAAFSGFKGVLMAPTEILAEQHFTTVSRLLGTGVALKTAVVVSSIPSIQKRTIRPAIKLLERFTLMASLLAH